MTNHKNDSDQTRRKFIQLGAAAFSITALTGASKPQDGDSAAGQEPQSGAGKNAPPQGIDMEKWKKLKGEAYPEGTQNTPGVCKLPGPNAKRNWPDPDKYKDTKKVPGMCQLCSTICGIVGHVKDGRVITVSYTHLTLPTIDSV